MSQELEQTGNGSHAETQRRGEQKEQTEWQKITGLASLGEQLPRDERRAAIRRLVKAVEALARQELEAKRQDDPRTFLWDPLREICVYLEISRSRLSQLTKELTGLAAHEVVDRIRAEKLKENMREELRAFVQANRNYAPTGRRKTDSRAVQLWRVLKTSRQTPDFSRETWAIELGFANYRRLYRACLVVYRKTPVQLEVEIMGEIVAEMAAPLPAARAETPVPPEPPKVQLLQPVDTNETKRATQALAGAAA